MLAPLMVYSPLRHPCFLLFHKLSSVALQAARQTSGADWCSAAWLPGAFLQLNLVRNAAPSATVAPFPGSFEPAEATHAALPPGVDPDWARAAAEEGVVAYKNLLGPRQNMSHIPGADVEAQEITTVADMLNFETKKTMYKRFSTGFGVFMIAQLCEWGGGAVRPGGSGEC